MFTGFYAKEGDNERLCVEIYAVPCGRDLSVTICGGTGHHVGAMALGCARPPKNGAARSANVSVVPVFEHRDDEAARYAAKILATRLHCVVAVAAGIHIDNADTGELSRLMELAAKAVDSIACQIEEARDNGQL